MHRSIIRWRCVGLQCFSRRLRAVDIAWKLGAHYHWPVGYSLCPSREKAYIVHGLATDAGFVPCRGGRRVLGYFQPVRTHGRVGARCVRLSSILSEVARVSEGGSHSALTACDRTGLASFSLLFFRTQFDMSTQVTLFPSSKISRHSRSFGEAGEMGRVFGHTFEHPARTHVLFVHGGREGEIT